MNINGLILEIAESGREATDDEIRRIREHVAGVGFEPDGQTKAGTSIDGLLWQGRTIRSNDWMDNSVAHFLRHAVARREWPIGTTFNEYTVSLQNVVKNPWGGIAIEKRSGQWHLTFVAITEDTTESESGGWTLVGYSVEYGYWVTGYQPKQGISHLNLNPDEGERWLCEPYNPIR